MMAKQTTNDDFPTNDEILRVLRGETPAFESIVRRFERPLRAWLATQVTQYRWRRTVCDT